MQLGTVIHFPMPFLWLSVNNFRKVHSIVIPFVQIREEGKIVCSFDLLE